MKFTCVLAACTHSTFRSCLCHFCESIESSECSASFAQMQAHDLCHYQQTVKGCLELEEVAKIWINFLATFRLIGPEHKVRTRRPVHVMWSPQSWHWEKVVARLRPLGDFDGCCRCC